MSAADRGGAALRCVIRGTHFARADDMPALAAAAGHELGASRTVLYVIDYDQVVLVPMTGEDDGTAPLAVEGTLAGRVFGEIRVLDVPDGNGGFTVWTPMLDGTDRLGVVEFYFGPDAARDDGLLDDCRDAAALIAETLSTRRSYGDAIELIRRRKPMTLPAELQWGQLPPLTFVTPRVAIAGVLVPTEEVAGDSFDYAVNGDIAHIAILDAMGHGLEATLMSALAVGALRNMRRRGAPLDSVVSNADRQIADRFGPERFVTAIVGELDTHTGVWTWITCGHPPTLVVRGGRVVKKLESSLNPPLGLLSDPPQAGSERLEPGDRLVLYSDGVTEARDKNGDFFGPDRLVDFVTRKAADARPAAETLRRLTIAILDHQAGVLQDDATAVLVDWLTDEEERTSPLPAR
jgi:serine/threonine protein phosphatase PrpC